MNNAKNLTVGIDANEANVAQKVGVNRYAYDLLCSIYKLQAGNKNDQNPIKFILYLRENPRSDMPKETSWWQYKILPASALWILTKLTPHLIKNPENLDVFFSPSHYLPLFSPVPFVCSIMDLGYLNFSGQFAKKDFWQLKLWTAKSISISKHIISISNSTKKDIVRHYKVPADKISVIYPSYDKGVFNTKLDDEGVARVKKHYSIVDDYILYLSTLKPSKNVEGLIEAFREVLKKKKCTLVVAGKKGWLYKSIFDKVKELKLEKNIIFTGFVDEEDKPYLIKGAKVFVLPSFWEGFGLDPLYAMGVGTPVIVSNVGSLPEVVGNAGLKVNPGNPSDIADKILEVLSMSKTNYNRLVEKGFEQVKKFSWEDSARETMEVLKKVVR